MFTKVKSLGSTLTSIEFRRKTALENAKLGVWEWDLTRDSITWDYEMFVIYSVDPRNFIPSYAQWETTVHPEDRVKAKLDTQVLLGENAPDRHSACFRIKKDNKWRWVLTTGKSIKDSSGKIVKMIGTNQLIDENIRIF
jgi:PAS domain-containing protein